MNQNVSDVKAAEQKARFARMDFDKFLGDTVSEGIIDEFGLDKQLAEAATNVVERPEEKPAPPAQPALVAQVNGGVVTTGQISDAPKVVAGWGSAPPPPTLSN